MIRLKDLREDKDLYQKDVAKVLNISQTTYSKYELEKINIPVESLRTLAIFFGTSTDFILGLTNDPSPYPRLNKMKEA